MFLDIFWYLQSTFSQINAQNQTWIEGFNRSKGRKDSTLRRSRGETENREMVQGNAASHRYKVTRFLDQIYIKKSYILSIVFAEYLELLLLLKT